jgi:hypothetical protein
MMKSELPAFSGLGKRTFRELERWDIEEEHASPATVQKLGNRSLADYSEERMEGSESISNICEDDH